MSSHFIGAIKELREIMDETIETSQTKINNLRSQKIVKRQIIIHATSKKEPTKELFE
jgi:hypothetical protein